MNKVNSKVELRFNVYNAGWLAPIRKRFVELHGNRMNKRGELILGGSSHRTQLANKREVQDRLAALVEEARAVPKERIATKPPKYAKERRLQRKKARSDKKKDRGRVKVDW